MDLIFCLFSCHFLSKRLITQANSGRNSRMWLDESALIARATVTRTMAQALTAISNIIVAPPKNQLALT